MTKQELIANLKNVAEGQNNPALSELVQLMETSDMQPSIVEQRLRELQAGYFAQFVHDAYEQANNA